MFNKKLNKENSILQEQIKLLNKENSILQEQIKSLQQKMIMKCFDFLQLTDINHEQKCYYYSASEGKFSPRIILKKEDLYACFAISFDKNNIEKYEITVWGWLTKEELYNNIKNSYIKVDFFFEELK